ncbi:hypothetical protein [Streptomyces sp. N2A]|uniref:hypothetical protein n=1 Tax=Streptomyces sp. N2A TaxID=3073936 RepID=UPI0028707FE6|nr:hypothetical protein [Streptomyces sp. N2A]
MGNGLIDVAKETYTTSLGEGVVPRPLMVPLVRGEPRDGHVLHQFPYSEQPLSRSPESWASAAPDWRPAPAPQPGGELVPPIQTAANFSFIPIELDHPDPFGVTLVLMEEGGYRISLTEAFAR